MSFSSLLTSYFTQYPWRLVVATFVVIIYSTNGLDSSKWGTTKDNESSQTSACETPLCVSTSVNQQNRDSSSDPIDPMWYTVIESASLLYGYHQLTKLHGLGSRYIIGVVSIYAAVCSLLFTISIQIFKFEFYKIRGSSFYFLLICDLLKSAKLAQTAEISIPSSINEICGRIKRGIQLVGPSIALDTALTLLVTSLGFTTGVPEIELISSFAFVLTTINFIVFLTIYPLLLLLILQFSNGSISQYSNSAQTSLDSFENCFCPKVHFETNSSRFKVKLVTVVILSLFQGYRWFAISFDQAILLTLTVILVIRYLFFEEKLLQSFDSSSTTTTIKGNIGQFHISPNTKTAPAAKSPPAYVPLRKISGYNLEPDLVDSAHPTVDQQAINSPNIEMPISELISKRSSSKGEKEESSHNILPKIHIPDQGYASRTPSDTQSGSVSPIGFRIGDVSDSDSEQDDIITIRKPSTDTIGIQTLESALRELNIAEMLERKEKPTRSIVECLSIYKSEDGGKSLTDAEVIALVNARHIPAYQLEKAVDDPERGVSIRRKLLGQQGERWNLTEDLPFRDYDYSKVMGACCENVVGYIPVPIGVAGPFNVDDVSYQIPMATTEGCLVASTNRGCRALVNGVKTRVVGDGMSRAPVVRFPSAMKASDAMIWLNEPENFQIIKESFDSTSRYARLQKIHCRIAGRYLYIRIVAKTGDAMGMNMISKGTEIALNTLQSYHPEMEIVALSGNVCTDKKPAAINWIEGRGKSVVAEAIVPAKIVENILKTSTAALVELNIAKNLVGSAMAGSIGGFNAHAANIVTAIYIATGQDPAQNVGSSNCMTLMEPWGEDGRDLFISCTMPSIEVGTVGGGTFLSAQSACLEMLGIKGAHPENPGENARTLARLVCATVLAGELSLMSALAAGHLVRSHLKHNRSTASFNGVSAPATPTSEKNSPPNNNSLSPDSIVTFPQRPCTLDVNARAEELQLNKENNCNTGSENCNQVISSSNNLPSRKRPSKSMEFLGVPDCKTS